MNNSIYTNDKQQDTNATSMETAPQKQYGGIGRLAFAGFLTAIVIVSFGRFFLFDPEVVPLVNFVFTIVMFVAIFVAFHLRLKNIGHSTATVLLLIIPFLGILCIWYGLLVPEGYKDSRRLDKAGWGVVVMTILPILIIIVIGLFSRN